MATNSPTDARLAAEIRRLIGQSTYAYDTHRPLLAEAIIRTSGPILELGMGFGSTPGLHAVAKLTGRRVESYDDDAEWFEKMQPFLFGQGHLVGDWDKADLSGDWAVALVDHGQVGRRVREIGRLAQTCKAIIAHDTEESVYRYWTIWGLFKHRVDDMRRKPWTTAFSNTLPVETWIE